MKKLAIIFVLCACSNKETTQQKAEAAVKKYIKENANDASSYKPVSFGKLDSIYTRDTISYWELDMIRRRIVAQFNAARNQGLQTKADSLRPALMKINNKMDSEKIFTGLKIYHISQGKNSLGEIVMNRGSFYLDTNFVVKEFVMTEDSLLMEAEGENLR